jgi:hypothetical protein
MAAISMMALIYSGAIALDLANVYLVKSEDQRIADQSAIAGAFAYAQSSSNATTAAKAASSLALVNGAGSASVATTIVNSPSGDGESAVEVVVTSNVNLTGFGRVTKGTQGSAGGSGGGSGSGPTGSGNAIAVSATSYAEIHGGAAPPCIIALQSAGMTKRRRCDHGHLLRGRVKRPCQCNERRQNHRSGDLRRHLDFGHQWLDHHHQPDRRANLPERVSHNRPVRQKQHLCPSAHCRRHDGADVSLGRQRAFRGHRHRLQRQRDGRVRQPRHHHRDLLPHLRHAHLHRRGRDRYRRQRSADHRAEHDDQSCCGCLQVRRFHQFGLWHRDHQRDRQPHHIWGGLSQSGSANFVFNGSATYYIQSGITEGSSAALTFTNTNSSTPSTFYVAGGIKVSNGSATFPNGTYVITSSDGTAGIDVAGGDSATFGNGSFNIAGGISTGGGSNLTIGSALYSSSIFQIPTVGSSGNALNTGGGNTLSIGAFTNVDINGPVTIGGSSVTLGAAMYTVNGAVNMSSSGGGSITGTGVQVVSSGAISFGAGFNAINFSAPTAITATTDGQLGTVSLATNSSSAFTITAGASNTDVLGAVYAPNSALTLSGAGNLNGGGACLQVVTASIALSGGSSLSTTCTSLGSSSASSSVSLVQ